MTNMTSGQNVVVHAAGRDGQNPAPINTITADINNHALAYVANIGDEQMTVTSRGIVGDFTLTVNAKNESGAALPPASTDFHVSANPASSLLLTVDVPYTGPNPDMPPGW